MNVIREKRDGAKPEIGSDVEAMLQAIHVRTSGEVKIHMDSDHAQLLRAGNRNAVAYSELAEAFELDIHDHASWEVNR
ncbi:DUF2525 domain-containing protein [Pantoea sp.]|uniref:DUF2525 domain-containing protein n=1 Tax=Pantoea sp. TaxID=69393 RepID=UPI00289AF6D3|nr:DUF2525 domain-containing protein [Pantoea sp.]